jgi:large subunit ribosomal protein L15
MLSLSSLKNTHRTEQKVQRVGRGNGSKRGKTCCRGSKGDKSRRGYKRRYGHEGGQLPLYRRILQEVSLNAKFKTKIFAMNLSDIEELFEDGEKVNIETLMEEELPHKFSLVD